MAEFNSRQIAGLVASPKIKAPPWDDAQIRVFTGSTPAVAAWAQNDTFLIAKVPKDTRILRSSKLWHGAFGASVTMAVGIRDAVTKAPIDAAGLLAATSVATAGLVKAMDSGALLNQVNGYVTTADVEVYATFAGAVPTANAQAEFELHLALPTP